MAFKVVIIGQGKPPPPSSAQGDAQSGPQSSQNVSKTATGEDEEFSFSGIPIVQHEPTGTSILNRQPNPAAVLLYSRLLCSWL